MVERTSFPLSDDLLLLIFSILPMGDMICFRQVCRQTWELLDSRQFWLNACKKHILQQGGQFPLHSLQSLPLLALKKLVLRAHFVGKNLTSSKPQVLQVWSCKLRRNERAKFVTTRGKAWIVVWDIQLFRPSTLGLLDPQNSRWCAWYDAIPMVSVSVNPNSFAGATFIIYGLQDGRSVLKLMSIQEEDDTTVSLHCVHTVDCTDGNGYPLGLYGNNVVWGLSTGSVIIRDWKTGGQLVLRCPDNDFDPHKVIFIGRIILVMGSTSTRLFDQPPMPLCSDCTIVHSESGPVLSGPISFYFQSPLSYDEDTLPSVSSMMYSDSRRALKFSALKDFNQDLSALLGHHGYLSNQIHGPCGTVAFCIRGSGKPIIMVGALPGPYNSTNKFQVKIKMHFKGWSSRCLLDYDEMEGQILIREHGCLKLLSLDNQQRPGCIRRKQIHASKSARCTVQ